MTGLFLDSLKIGRRSLLILVISALIVIGSIGFSLFGTRFKVEKRPKKTELKIKLPQPSYRSEISIEEALKRRRSIREYEDRPLTIKHVSQLFWAAQGVTKPDPWLRAGGFKTAPSAGATYPLEVYMIVKEGGVEGLEAGIYHYLPKTHEIELLKKGDYSRDLMKAALDQEWVGAAPINMVITAIYERTTGRYGDRGIRYVHMEVGHVGENVYLQCVSLGLGCVVIGAFYDDQVKEILGVDEAPLYIIPIGFRKS